MSHECSECERDLRGGHDVGCSRWAKFTLEMRNWGLENTPTQVAVVDYAELMEMRKRLTELHEKWCRGCHNRDIHIDRLTANVESKKQANANLTEDVLRLEAEVARLRATWDENAKIGSEALVELSRLREDGAQFAIQVLQGLQALEKRAVDAEAENARLRAALESCREVLHQLQDDVLEETGACTLCPNRITGMHEPGCRVTLALDAARAALRGEEVQSC